MGAYDGCSGREGKGGEGRGVVEDDVFRVCLGCGGVGCVRV